MCFSVYQVVFNQHYGISYFFFNIGDRTRTIQTKSWLRNAVMHIKSLLNINKYVLFINCKNLPVKGSCRAKYL